MIILFVVSHTIIKDPYVTYLAFSKKKKKKNKIGHFFWEPIKLPKPNWIRHWVCHNSLSKLKEHTVKVAKTAFLRSIKSLKVM